MVEDRLGRLVEAATLSRLDEAMRHALLGPGKRVRPLVTLATVQRFGGSPAVAVDAACTLELLHTASLVLDDLPSMDDATLRRGLPATHLAFGESTAVLAAIGLIGLAFETAAAAEQCSGCKAGALTRCLAVAIGARGLAGGQYADLNPPAGHVAAAQVRLTHERKTGALFAAAAEVGAIMAHAGPEACADMRAFGFDIGLTFQQLDDVIDATGSEEQAGKDVRRDTGTATVIKLAGVQAAKTLARAHMERALDRLGHVPRPDPLSDLVVELLGTLR